LLGRKVAGSRGELLKPLLEDIQSLLAEPQVGLEKEYQQLAEATQLVDKVTRHVLERVTHDENIINSVAVEYLNLVGYVAFAYMWLRMAKVAQPLVDERPYLASKVKTAKFYMARILPRIHGLIGAIEDGSESLYEHEVGEF